MAIDLDVTTSNAEPAARRPAVIVTWAFLAQHLVRMLMQSSMSISARAPAHAFGATPRQIWAHSCEHGRSASSGPSERRGTRRVCWCLVPSHARHTCSSRHRESTRLVHHGALLSYW